MRRRALAAVTLALPLLLSGCSDDGGTSASESASPTSSAASSAPASSAPASGSASPGASAPAPTGDVPPEFCEAARAFSESNPLDTLAQDASPEQVEQALNSGVDQTQRLAETAPQAVRPTFEKLATSYVQLRDLVAEVGFVRQDVDQARLAEIEPDTTPAEEQAVDAVVAQCGIG